MLVLSRKVGDEIVIGEGDDKIIVALTEIRRSGHARIGVIAPKHVPVHRREIWERIEAERAIKPGLQAPEPLATLEST